ncbi:MAG: serine hydrolase [Dongiaceae bacterium]
MADQFLPSYFARRRLVVAALLSVALVLGIGGPGAMAANPASIIVDAETGAVIYEQNSRGQNYPASLTKLMTLYLLFEALESKKMRLHDLLKVSSAAAQQPPTNMRLRAGERLPVATAIQALVVHSANDVAAVVAEALGGTESNFAGMMTRKAKELGMKDTVFRNASGLPSAGQVTTARDMAIMARALVVRFPNYYHYFSLQGFSYKGRAYRSHNRVLSYYKGADGLKTGYIRASGYNVATSAQRDGRRLIAVVMGGKSAKSRDLQMVQLLDRGFKAVGKGTNLKTANLMESPPQPLAPATTKKVASASGAPQYIVPPVKPTATIQVAVLPPKPPAGKSTASIVSAKKNGGWGIQVGAFNGFKMAHEAAVHASQRLPSLLTGTQLVVDETVKGNGKLYRARLMGLSKQEAQTACRELKAKKIACLAFQSDLTLAMNPAQ